MAKGIWIKEILEGIKLHGTSPKKNIEKDGQNVIVNRILKYL